MRNTKEERHHQVEKRSGYPSAFRLDALTLERLAELQNIYKEHGKHYSQGVMVRRSIQSHLDHLKKLEVKLWPVEMVDTERAKAGVL